MTKTRRGIDIAEKRLDFLSKAFFTYILKQNAGQNILDLGCGSGRVGIAAAFLHHNSFLYDIEDLFELEKKVNDLSKKFSINIYFKKQDLSVVDYTTFPKNIGVVYMGSFFHYLKYKDALNLLKILKKNMKTGKCIFVSVSGIESNLSDGYPKELDIKKRFSLLEQTQADAFSIHKPVALYAEKDLINIFLVSGFSLVEIKKTAFGNLKGVFKKI